MDNQEEVRVFLQTIVDNSKYLKGYKIVNLKTKWMADRLTTAYDATLEDENGDTIREVSEIDDFILLGTKSNR